MNKSKRVNTQPQFYENERALRELALMKHRDLQRSCIVRGLESKNVVEFDHHKLVSWFIKNYDNTQDDSLLINHDQWVEDQLLARGYKKDDILLSPALRFGYVGDIEEMDKPKIIKINKSPGIESPRKKEKATIDEKTGLRKGTKKALTYELYLSGLGVADIIKKVKSEFPEAEEKSIKIWAKRASKLQK